MFCFFLENKSLFGCDVGICGSPATIHQMVELCRHQDGDLEAHTLPGLKRQLKQSQPPHTRNKTICWPLQFGMEFIRACLQRLLLRVGAILRSVSVPPSRRGLASEGVKHVEPSPPKCVLLVMRLLASSYSWMEEWKEEQKQKRAESRFAGRLTDRPPPLHRIVPA